MANDRYQIHFNPKGTYSRRSSRQDSLRRSDDLSSSDYLKRILSTSTRDDVDEEDEIFDPRSNLIDMFGELKVFSKKKARRTILDGKVLNCGKKRYRKWRRHDKDIIRDVLTEPLQEMIDNDEISFRKAKRLRKTITKRILSCFYAKGKDD